jgi:hypothetical protein
MPLQWPVIYYYYYYYLFIIISPNVHISQPFGSVRKFKCSFPQS